MFDTSNVSHFTPNSNEGWGEESAGEDHNPVPLVLTIGGLLVVAVVGMVIIPNWTAAILAIGASSLAVAAIMTNLIRKVGFGTTLFWGGDRRDLLRVGLSAVLVADCQQPDVEHQPAPHGWVAWQTPRNPACRYPLLLSPSPSLVEGFSAMMGVYGF